ncbi:MAG: 50S ribosomal protein L21 [Candidatus Peregrinibacteria bacterium]|nr:50S ribosomal protein L21 [Candidatus Peregrinibacteria bacterium]
MFAVVQMGSTQYPVQEKDEILVDRMDLEEGKNYMMEKVLLYSDDEGKNTMLGMPYLENVKVEARVVGHERGKKLRVFKMKPKKRYERTQGHRSDYTRLRVLKISVLTGGAKAKAEAVPKKAAAPKKPAAKKAVAKQKDASKAE